MKIKFLFLTAGLLLVLTACGAKTGGASEALPTVALDSATPVAQSALPASGGVAASGVVVPAQEAQMAFTIGGNVATVNVAVGDTVKAGDLLVELDNTTIKLDVAQAERNLRELTSPAAIAAASQVVANSRKALEDAQDKAESLFFPRASDTLIDNTQAEIDLAKKRLPWLRMHTARLTDCRMAIPKKPRLC